MVTTLKDYLRDNKARGFKSAPHYFADGDYLTYYFRDDRAFADRVDDCLTVYRSMISKEIVGCKIKGVRHILETAGKFGVLVGDGTVQLGLFFLYLSGKIAGKDEVTIRRYDEIGALAKDVVIDRSELISH